MTDRQKDALSYYALSLFSDSLVGVKDANKSFVMQCNNAIFATYW